MKKLILLAVFSVFVFTGIASAQTTLDISGIVRIYPEANNYGFGMNSLGSAQKTVNFVDQRMRLFFNFKSGEELGGVWAVELDGRWGDAAYVAGRNTGLALEGDSINVESKSINFWWKPVKDLKLTFGLQGYTDDFRGAILGGADAAGVRATYAIDKDSSVDAGYYVFSDRNVQLNDSVFFVPITYKRKIGPGTLGVSYLYLQDNGGRGGRGEAVNNAGAQFRDLTTNATYVTTNYAGGTAQFGNGSNTTAIFNSGILPAEYSHAHSNYLGLSYTGKAMSDKLTYDAMAFYNVGTIRGVPSANGVPVGNPAAMTVTPSAFEKMDMGIDAYALALMLQYKAGASTIRARYLHSGGGRSLSDYNGVVTGNQYAIGADLPLMQDDVYILLRNINDITHSTALLPDINNQGRGVNFYSAAYSYDINDKWNAQVGYGWLDSGVTRNASFANALPYAVPTGYNAAAYNPYTNSLDANVWGTFANSLYAASAFVDGNTYGFPYGTVVSSAFVPGLVNNNNIAPVMLLNNNAFTGGVPSPQLQNYMSGKGKHMGSEINGKVTYKFNKNFSITGLGAYAFLGEFYDNLYLYSAPANILTGYPYTATVGGSAINSISAFHTNLYGAAAAYNTYWPAGANNTGLQPKDLYRLMMRFSYNF